jgi:hypothetical protein
VGDSSLQEDDKAMDLRQASRYSVNEPVRVRSSDDPQSVADGVIRDISDDGVGLTLNGYFPAGSVVKLECKKCLLRGKVIFCLASTPSGLDASFDIGIRIEHVEWGPAEQVCDSAKEPVSVK